MFWQPSRTELKGFFRLHINFQTFSQSHSAETKLCGIIESNGNHSPVWTSKQFLDVPMWSRWPDGLKPACLGSIRSLEATLAVMQRPVLCVIYDKVEQQSSRAWHHQNHTHIWLKSFRHLCRQIVPWANGCVPINLKFLGDRFCKLEKSTENKHCDLQFADRFQFERNLLICKVPCVQQCIQRHLRP